MFSFGVRVCSLCGSFPRLQIRERANYDFCPHVVRGLYIAPPLGVLVSSRYYKQYSVNIYNKHLERLKVQEERGKTDTAELKASEGVLRIEIQVKKNKLNTIKRNIKRDFDFDGKPIEYFSRYDVAIPIVMRALEDITGRADYSTFETAKNAF